MTHNTNKNEAGKNASSHSTLSEYRQLLLAGDPIYTSVDLAQKTQTDLKQVNEYWVAMGFPPVKETDLTFTDADLQAYHQWIKLITEEKLDSPTALSLARAQSHIADRLALWQVEALVDDVSRRFQLDDTAARLATLDRFREFLPFLENQLTYAWKRQLESLLTRIDQEVSHRGVAESPGKFPLIRTFGFVDMVSYTSSSSHFEEGKLIDLINRFETICRETVPVSGGRVVKMLGDAVFYIADDLPTGLRVVTSLMRKLTSEANLLPVRASVVQGKVFSRSGDVFGPPVNLASRLTDVAPVGQILTDAETAGLIVSGQGGSQYFAHPTREADLRGVGKVRPFQVSVR